MYHTVLARREWHSPMRAIELNWAKRGTTDLDQAGWGPEQAIPLNFS